MDYLHILDRSNELFVDDANNYQSSLNQTVENSRFLVIGGAGSIGQAVVKEIFKRQPKVLHVCDISENNLVELVRDIRSTLGYIDGEFKTFAIDCGSLEFEIFLNDGAGYDYVFNLSALKHVRSEKDPFTLMRMINVNIFNTVNTVRQARKLAVKNYFCVSTDKAANPVNMMGASKRIMELFLMRESLTQNISMARFANVAFSDGSLLHGFNQRFIKRQPLSAPSDVRRYFVTPKESGMLCLFSGLLANNRDIFFPKINADLELTTFSSIAERFISALGFEPYFCQSEEQARADAENLIRQKKWPCYFFSSDTTGEKAFEEFYTISELLNLDKFKEIGIIKNEPDFSPDKLDDFWEKIHRMQINKHWSKKSILDAYFDILPSFAHQETGKYLDDRM